MKLLFVLGLPEIILIVLIVLLLFGGKKIPELMRGIGKGVHEFKEGLDGKSEAKDEASSGENSEHTAQDDGGKHTEA